MPMIYPYGQAIDVPDRESFYRVMDQYKKQVLASGGNSSDFVQQFSNNPFGVSAQEIQGRVGAFASVNPDSLGGSSGGSYGGSYGGGSAPAYIRGSLQDKIDALNNLYNVLTNDINTLTQERRGQLEEGYGTQTKELQGQYEKNQGILPWSFAARNTRYSSDYENAQQDAADVYNKNQTAIAKDKETKLADLGRTYAGQIASIDSGRSALGGVNPNFYGTQADFDSARSNFDRQLSDLSTQRAGLGTTQGYLGKLASIAPVQTTGVSDLQAQLQKLSQSSIPGFAKQTIAQGLIKQSGGNEKELSDYFETITAGQNKTPLG